MPQATMAHTLIECYLCRRCEATPRHSVPHAGDAQQAIHVDARVGCVAAHGPDRVLARAKLRMARKVKSARVEGQGIRNIVAAKNLWLCEHQRALVAFIHGKVESTFSFVPKTQTRTSGGKPQRPRAGSSPRIHVQFLAEPNEVGIFGECGSRGHLQVAFAELRSRHLGIFQNAASLR